jgi:lipoprotein-anchoring transpeptidase ErfK/SrfK
MKLAYWVVAPALALAACSPPSAETNKITTVAMSETSRAEMERVNAARFTLDMPASLSDARTRPEPASAAQANPGPADGAPPAQPAAGVRYDPGMVRLQVMLDRAHFSPGVIDGYDGENVRKALSAYQAANSLPVTGRADDALLHRLEQAGAAPALVAYVLTEEDVRGPFVDVPDSMEAMSSLDRVGYESAAEAIAEKFHMDEDLLRQLNPGVQFTAGTEIVVANAGGGISGQVASIEVAKDEGVLRAFDANGRLLAFYPATIGSASTPAPSGELEITAVAFDPTYHYDADNLPSFNDDSGRKFTIAAGPNNPVGVVWIALSRDGYGIHGTPEPQLISKTASHGCVRLTNWDAAELGRVVRAGVPVNFVETAMAAARRGRG